MGAMPRKEADPVPLALVVEIMSSVVPGMCPRASLNDRERRIGVNVD